MDNKLVPEQQETLLQLATEQLEGVDLRTRLDIDTEVTLSDLGGNTFQLMQRLAPFGRGNPPPAFLSRGVENTDCRTMGTNREHLRMKVKQDGTIWDAVGFGLGNYLAEVSHYLDIVYNLDIDRWGGVETLRLNILDFAPANQTEPGNGE